MPSENTPVSASVIGKSTQLNPYRIEIVERLGRLISPGIAQLYDDACAHMEADPKLATTVHTVGHLLREVESALRAVLRSITSLSEKTCDGCGKPLPTEKCASCGRPSTRAQISQKKEIEAILKALGFEEDDPIEAAWRDYAERSERYAHRKNLDAPRPYDSGFANVCSNLESVLVGVLDRFEKKYVGVYVKLDELAALPTPSQKDAAFFNKNIPNSPIIHGYFFDKLENKLWLPMLRDHFLKIPKPVSRPTGELYFPPWPPAKYLKLMATQVPDEVMAIVKSLDDTDNEQAKDSLLEIVNELPTEHQTALVDKVLKWI